MESITMHFLGDFTVSSIVEVIILGFILINVTFFLLNKKVSSNLIAMFIMGYLIDKILPWSFYVKAILSLLLSYLIYRLYKFGKLKSIFKFLKIYVGVNDTVWEEMDDEIGGATMKAGFKEIDTIYSGQVDFIETNKEKTHVILSNFSKYHFSDDELSDPIIDGTDMPNVQVIIDTSKADYIEMYYTNESRKAKV